jgi:CSLREA domain-containing protein
MTRPAAFLLLLALLLPPGVGHAATITVTTTDDELNTDGDCSLREAVRAADTNLAVDACGSGAFAGTDVIMLPAGTYTLTLPGDEGDAMTGDLDVFNGALTIIGAGAATTVIDGNGATLADRVFEAMSSLTLEGVTIRGGYANPGQGNVGPGGGIYAQQGTLTLTDCVVTMNTSEGLGGGIYAAASSSVVLTRTTLSQNMADEGGGLYASGADTTITDSTIEGNEVASQGGGIWTGGGQDFQVTISGSTITGNTTHDNTAGLFVGSHSMCTLTNSTVSGNMADNYAGGLMVALGTATLNNVTVADNMADFDGVGGGDTGGVLLGVSSTLFLRNSIVAGNTDEGTSPDCRGGLTSQGHNVIGDTTGCSYAPGAGDQTDTPALLGPLADNGGPTQTHALLAGSPARDMGDPGVPGSGGTTCEAVDQRGIARPVGAACDAGAFEAPMPGGTTTTTTTTTTTIAGLSSSTTSSTTTTTLPPPLCASPAAIDKARVTVTKLNAAPGRQKVVVEGTLRLADGVPLDPAASGVQVLVEDLGNPAAAVLDLTSAGAVPPGGRGTGCGGKDGWKGATYRNKSGSLDAPTCTPGSAAGLRELTLKDRRRKGKGVHLALEARKARVVGPVGPLAVTVVVGDTGAPCAEHRFDAGACKLTKKRLRCR